jgi:hypothetical protein
MPTERGRTTSTRIPRCPDVRVRLVGEDGNAFAILGRTRRALLQAGAGADDIAEFFRAATAGDYDHLLATVLRWLEVE